MVDAQCGHFPGIGEAAGQGCASQQGSDQPWTGGIGHAAQIAWRGLCLGHDASHQGKQPADVIAGGQLRHHASIDPVKLDLTENFMGEQTPAGVQDGRGTLVA